MRFLRQSLTGLLMLSLTAGLLFYAGYSIYQALAIRAAESPTPPPRRERVFVVNTVTARPGPETPVLEVFGEIESARVLEIRTRSGGVLVEVSDVLENGARVRAGQFLARVDPAEAQFALDRSEADLTDARAEVREAERGLTLARDELAAARQQSGLRDRALARQRDLETRGVGTSAAVELAELEAFQADQTVLTLRQGEAAAEARVDQAQTRLARARTAFAEAGKRLEDTTIVANFDGVLQDVAVVQGRFVAANERIATLVDDAALDVAFRVSTAQYARLLDDTGHLVRAPVTVRLDAFGLAIEAPGSITRDSASVGVSETGRLLYARLDKTQGLKPGDFVTVRIEEPQLENVVRLPATALGPDGDILIVAQDSRVQTQPVTLVRRQRDTVLVRGDNLQGVEVVAQRTPVLGAGVRVRVQPMSIGPGLSDARFVTLAEDRRTRLIAHVEASGDMADEVKARLIEELQAPQVSRRTIERLEQRIGG
ncbi:MAG: efflux RND transporter periplasmic adaptor subunit [Pseudomonadota bacterium]